MTSAQQFKYPLGTIAVDGPDNTQATKLVASVLTRPTRSFRGFAAGVSPDAIVKTLNREGVAAPFGRAKGEREGARARRAMRGQVG